MLPNWEVNQYAEIRSGARVVMTCDDTDWSHLIVTRKALGKAGMSQDPDQ